MRYSDKVASKLLEVKKGLEKMFSIPSPYVNCVFGYVFYLLFLPQTFASGIFELLELQGCIVSHLKVVNKVQLD